MLLVIQLNHYGDLSIKFAEFCTPVTVRSSSQTTRSLRKEGDTLSFLVTTNYGALRI